MVLFFSEKRSRTFYWNTIDVMGGCAGRHLGGPGGVLQADVRNSKKHAGRSFNVSSLASPRARARAPADTSFSSQFVRKPWKLRVFLETTRKHGNGSDSYLSLEVTPYCGGNFSRMTSFSSDFLPLSVPPFPQRPLRLLGYFAIRSEQRFWITVEIGQNYMCVSYKVV